MGAPKVFICYCKDDQLKAAEVYDSLQNAGVEPWIDSKKLVLGDEWEAQIKNAVEQADAFVVLLRPGFDEIGFRQKEVRWAIEALQLRPPGRGFIIPFIVEPCQLPKWCRPIHAGSHRSQATSFEELVRAVETHCGMSLPLVTRRLRRFMEMLGWPDAEDRKTAASKLGSMREAAREAVPVLAKTLGDRDLRVRIAAANALGWIGRAAEDAVPFLLEARSDVHYAFVEKVVEALGRIARRNDDVVPALSELLVDHPIEAVRQEAAIALSRFGEEAKSAVPALIEAYNKRTWMTCFFAMAALGDVGPSEAEITMPILLESLCRGPDIMRAAAAVAIGKVLPGASAELKSRSERELIDALQDEYIPVRSDVIRGLVLLGSDAAGAVPALRTMAAHDEDPHVRQAARDAVRKITRACT